MRRSEKHRHYWYTHVITLLRLYPDRIPDTPRGKEEKAAITQAILDTLMLEDGTEIISAVNLIYFEERNTMDGVAQIMYVSERTVRRWIHDFVYRIADNLGYRTE